MSLDLFYMPNFNPNFKIELNMRDWSIYLALALTFKSSLVYEFCLFLYA